MTIRERLEKLVQERKTAQFAAEIKSFARKHADADSRVQISDWFRRLGKLPQALKALTGFESVPSGASTDTPEGRIRLQAAHLLNQAGASLSALQIVSQLDLKQAGDFRIAGMIALDNFEFHLALDYLETFHRLDRDKTSYRSRLTQIARADVLSELGKYNDAIEIVRKLRVDGSETLLQAIRLQAEGEYLARAGKMRESLTALRASEKLMPSAEGTVDSAFLWKWLGYVLGKLGEHAESRSYFKKAEPILASPSLRIEAYLHFLLVQTTAGSHPDLKLIQRMRHYPGVGHGFTQIMNRFSKFSSDLKPIELGFRKARLQIFPELDEYQFGKQWKLGIPLELSLAAALGTAEDWGVSLVRAKATLWPEEVFQFFALDNRVHALLHRLKIRHRLKTRIQDGVIRLTSESSVRVSYGNPTPSFLQKHEQFTRDEFARHYGLSSTQSKHWLNQWIALKRI